MLMENGNTAPRPGRFTLEEDSPIATGPVAEPVGHFGEAKNILPLWGLEPRLCFPARV
jgi:hypothetical protein